MSAVIGICSVNFCIFMSDGRQVKLDANCKVEDVISEKHKKVYKINNNLLFAATGCFQKSELPDDVFKGCLNKKNLTLEDAKDMIVDYCEKNKENLIVRSYLLGGKDERGLYSMYAIKYDYPTRQFILDVKRLLPSQSVNFAITGLFPKPSYEEFIQKNLNDTFPWKTYHNIIKHMKNTIRDIAEVDESVNTKIYIEEIGKGYK